MRKSLKILFLLLLVAFLASTLSASNYPGCSCGGDDWEFGAYIGNLWQAAKAFLGF